MLGERKKYTLKYAWGEKVGGVNLPFDRITDALGYASVQRATEAVVEDATTCKVVATYTRKDARHSWRAA